MNIGHGAFCRLIGVAAFVTLAAGAVVAGAPSPSPVVFPPMTSELAFDHARHRRTPCLDCHASIAASTVAADRNLPAESTCRPCHTQTRQQDIQRESPEARCLTCHRGYAGKGSPARTDLPAANLRFGHRLHLDRGGRCRDCHRMNADGRPLPSMQVCLTCHRTRGASVRCGACHLTQKDGRLKTGFPSGTLRPSGALKGEAHTERWSRDHAHLARTQRRHCDTCHTERDCLSCHDGSLRPLAIHTGDYIQRHAGEARRDQPRCQSCHRSQTFCLGCHQRLGLGRETDKSGFKPHTELSYHPAGFIAYTPGPGHHSFEARRNLRTCTACHRESTCIRCHGSRSVGKAGVSPHPPGFRASRKCRTLAAANPRVCLKCHPESDPGQRCP